MGKTSIEWTDFSVNPIRARFGDRVGHYCEKVSPGCKHCYSSRLQPRFGLPVFQEQRNAGVEPFLDVSKLHEVLRRKKPTRWFWCDMTDMFGEWVPFDWIAVCFGVMAATPHHTHQVLTKRPARAREWFGSPYADEKAVQEHALGFLSNAFPLHPIKGTILRRPWPLPNVWLGVSVEDHKRANERIPLLLGTPAAVRFLSCEPLLGPVVLTDVALPGFQHDRFDALRGVYRGALESPRVDWVIVGGESGPGARPFDLAWARSILAQCKAAGVPAFCKQLGARAVGDFADLSPGVQGLRGSEPRNQRFDLRGRFEDRKGGEPSEWPADLRVRQFPEVRHA